MSAPPIHFLIDENLGNRQLPPVLTDRGHRVTPVQIKAKDQAILASAEQEGAVVITSDKWFFTQLKRTPGHDKRRFHRAGVVLVPGEWGVAHRRICEWLPVIETAFEVIQQREDKRLVIHVRASTILIEAEDLS